MLLIERLARCSPDCARRGQEATEGNSLSEIEPAGNKRPLIFPEISIVYRDRKNMPDEEEFAARSQLKWQPDGDAWILLYRRKRMGRVVPDTDFPGMWRSVKTSGLSDMASLS